MRHELELGEVPAMVLAVSKANVIFSINYTINSLSQLSVSLS